jgi:hypothetical protein
LGREGLGGYKTLVSVSDASEAKNLFVRLKEREERGRTRNVAQTSFDSLFTGVISPLNPLKSASKRLAIVGEMIRKKRRSVRMVR